MTTISKLRKAGLVLSLFGFLNAAYVSYLYFFVIKANSNEFSFCDINDKFSCTAALSLGLNIFGIPPCTIAMVVYPLIAYLLYKGGKGNITTVIGLTIGGILMNLWLLYNESLVNIYCLLCILCGVIITGILITTGFELKNLKTNSTE